VIGTIPQKFGRCNMKKIINGRKYDTETATRVGHYWNGLSDRDFRNVEEALYQKKTGEFFLAGNGGPMSKYAQPCGDMTSGGKDIIPQTQEEAKMWSEEHLDAEEYEAIFGPTEE